MVLTTTRRRPMNVRNPWDWFGRDFGDLLGPFTGADEDVTAAYPVDIREDNDHVTLEAELPGFTTDQIDVTLENGVLRIDAQRDAGETPEGKKHLNERRFTRVSRAFTVPKTVDENKVDAKLDHGVLHLTLHKREEVKPRRIEVK